MHGIFPKIHALVAEWEDGYINHPNDPGGATNYGVSLHWLKSIGFDVNGDGLVDINDIRALTPELAMGLFRTHFWEAVGLDALPELVAALVYEGGVNMGTPRAVRHLQKVCNLVQGGPLLKVDGVCGPATAARVRQLCTSEYSQLTLCRNVLNTREEFYRQLAAQEPYWKNGKLVDYRPFLKGWLNRTAAVWRWLQEQAGGGRA